MTIQHFLTLKDLPVVDIRGIVERAAELKNDPNLAANVSRKTLGLVLKNLPQEREQHSKWP